jgi:hypothetical protein
LTVIVGAFINWGFSGVTLDTLLLKVRKKDKWIVLFDYFRSDIEAGPSGLAMISLQKQDSLLVFEYNGELKGFWWSRIREILEKNLHRIETRWSEKWRCSGSLLMNRHITTNF